MPAPGSAASTMSGVENTVSENTSPMENIATQLREALTGQDIFLPEQPTNTMTVTAISPGPEVSVTLTARNRTTKTVWVSRRGQDTTARFPLTGEMEGDWLWVVLSPSARQVKVYFGNSTGQTRPATPLSVDPELEGLPDAVKVVVYAAYAILSRTYRPPQPRGGNMMGPASANRQRSDRGPGSSDEVNAYMKELSRTRCPKVGVRGKCGQ